MKKVMVSATFPEVAASKAQQSAGGEGESIPTAVRRALETIMKREGVKGRRGITHFRMTVTVEDATAAGAGGED